MLNRKIISLAGAFALVLGMAQPVLAQDSPERTESDRASGTQRGERVLPGRIGGDRNERAQQRDRAPRGAARRQAARPAPAAEQQTPEAIRAAAQAQLTANGLTCELTEASNPGLIAEAQVYEAACANAPGYILIASTPPQSFNCLELAGTAAIARSRDPAADVGQQCVMPANLNGLAVIGGYAREAGVTCEIDEAVVIGKSDENMVYEVGCAGTDGSRLEREATGWVLTDCLQVVSTGQTCRFTTEAEQNATLKAKLTGTEAAACDVTQTRLMGQNANGRFFEVKCAAEGQGFITRLNNAGVTQQVYPCATAQRIGGGCTLTPAPAAAAATTGGRP